MLLCVICNRYTSVQFEDQMSKVRGHGQGHRVKKVKFHLSSVVVGMHLYRVPSGFLFGSVW